ncbi:tripartite tricarboxylate transporter TctB family protein [Candidatus Pelagibacter sp.]|nr:tripartite tricarboxylate transporter TctB family protein [Candidatus Pelagibacter sp.]
MKNVQKQKRANKSLPFFFRDEFRVSLIIVLVSVALLITTFTFDIVPPILNRGIQPATFPKALLVLIILMTLLIYFLATKNPWKVKKKLPQSFYLTVLSFLIFVFISKSLDFFLAISALSIFVSYSWGEKRIFYLLLVGIIFPVIVFIFFETILGLRFPPGIITNIYYS